MSQRLKEQKTPVYSPQFSPYYSDGEDEGDVSRYHHHNNRIISNVSNATRVSTSSSSSSLSTTTTSHNQVNIFNISNIQSTLSKIQQTEQEEEEEQEEVGKNTHRELQDATKNTSSMDVSSSSIVDHVTLDEKKADTTTATTTQTVSSTTTTSHHIQLNPDMNESKSSIAYVDRYDQTVFWIVKNKETSEDDFEDDKSASTNLIDFFEIRLK